ncbi:thioredoxin [Pasteurellaceae bacterium Macca]|nr:thioredoxin [Pasteurellaceae bacterium Macca]
MKKSSLILRFVKNICLFGGLFIIVSIAVDWYRKPTAPAEFSQKVLSDTQNQPHIIAQMSHEQPMLLYFWGSWCSFCRFTSPAIQELTQQGVPVLSVALKSGSDAEVANYLQEQGYHFPAINDPTGEFSRQWDIQATPTILIIKKGKIINHTTGLTSYWGLKTRLVLANWAW